MMFLIPCSIHPLNEVHQCNAKANKRRQSSPGRWCEHQKRRQVKLAKGGRSENMSSRVVHTGGQDPIPLFSPTQVPSGEQVLHSIFSPNLQGGVTTYDSIDKQNRGQEKRKKVAVAAKRLKPCTPPSPAYRGKENAPNTAKKVSKYAGASTVQSPDQFFSPRSEVPLHVGAKTFVAATPSNLARNAFFSPRNAQQSPDFASPVSAISALTNASTSSFKTLPIDMLSYEFVSTCNSPEALKQIVNTLSADSPRHFPSLLRTAKKQLESINETMQQQNEAPGSNLNSLEGFQKESALYVSSTRDESSLALSLSSSLLDDEIVEAQVAGTSEIGYKKEITKQPTASNALICDKRKATPGDRRGIATIKPDASRTRETKLIAEMQQMAEKVHVLETIKEQDKKNLLLKLKSLEEAKNQAERKVTVLEKAVASSSAQTRDMSATLAEVRDESKQLQGLLRNEKEAARCKILEARKVQDGLQRKIDILSEQLAQCKERAADATKSMEKRFRLKAEKESAQRDSDVRSLKQALEDARMNLDAIKEERNETLHSIQHALGKSTDGVRTLMRFYRRYL